MKQLSSLLVLAFIVAFSPSFSQNATAPIPQDSVMRKWLHATINFEVVPVLYQYYHKLFDSLDAHKITRPQLDTMYHDAVETESGEGTGIFLKYHNTHYLITARHMLYDPTSIPGAPIYSRIILIENGFAPKNTFENTTLTQSAIFISDSSEGRELMRLDSSYYIISNENEDVGIIKLDTMNTQCRNLIRTLYRRGYRPIGIDDIDINPVKVNDHIMAIGYPVESLYGKPPSTIRELDSWQSRIISVPSLSWGNVAKLPSIHALAPNTYFAANIFVYHGFSGGPAIKNNKLVGIVSQGYDRNVDTFIKIGPSPLDIYLPVAAYFPTSKIIMKYLKLLEAQPAEEGDLYYREQLRHSKKVIDTPDFISRRASAKEYLPICNCSKEAFQYACKRQIKS